MMNGMINIYKEPGFTSHDVVAKLRGIVKQKKIGHTGTLDPDAEGVLPVCLGKATRLCELLADETKTYEAVLLLGVTTDTQDAGGTVLMRRSVTCTEEEIRCLAGHFQGEQLQIPPMYSALKQNGKRLYELAREGKVVERAPRPVTFYEIIVSGIELPRVRLQVTCSKGTYIRTLCHDLGEMLGCGGCMEHLIRTRVGRFQVEQALRLGDVQLLADTHRLSECLLPIEAVFEELPVVETRVEADVAARNGNRLTDEQVLFRCLSSKPEDGTRVRLYDSQQIFIGVFQYDAGERVFRPLKMFYDGCETVSGL